MAKAYSLDIKGNLSTFKDIKAALEKELELYNENVDSSVSSQIDILKKNTAESKERAVNEAMEKIPVMRERFANLGLSPDGGRVRTEETRFKNALDSTLADFDKNLTEKSLSLQSDAENDKNRNYLNTLEKLRSEAVRLEKEAYDRKQDAIANQNKKKQLQLDEAYYKLKEATAANDIKKDKFNIIKSIADMASKSNANRYLEILKNYGSSILGELGLEVRQSDISLTKDEIKIIRNNLKYLNMTDEERQKYYNKSGLSNYMTLEEALK